ncbi:MAG: esterase family protein [Gemmataceae bacterium]|nr:esterase family protein [Gemmataceae bacterium]
MNGFALMVSLWVDGLGMGQVPHALLGPCQVARANAQMKGRLLYFDRKLLTDHRLWSPALRERRRLLVYLPPGYDPGRKYPLALFLHGAAQDEKFFLQALAIPFDRAICAGLMPPVIIAAPDGSIRGRSGLLDVASFWADTKAGQFEQYLMGDVWDFLHREFPLREGRESKAIIGVSMGGSAAMRLGIAHKDRVKCVLAVMPLLNLRYADCRGEYRTPFDPACTSFQDRYKGWDALGRRRIFVLRNKDLYTPLFGKGQEVVDGMSRLSPIEQVMRGELAPGELDLYVGWGAKDEFNVAAQCESFLHEARRRGIEVAAEVDPKGRHDVATGLRLLPGMARWASGRVAK